MTYHVHNPAVVERLPLFVEAIQKATDTYFAAHLKNSTPAVISAPVLVGTRYCRIVKTDAPQGASNYQSRSVWGFVDLASGDILKAAGWKAPAKHARGNILTPDFDAANWTLYGPKYL